MKDVGDIILKENVSTGNIKLEKSVNTDFLLMTYLLKKADASFYVQDLDYYDKKINCEKIGKLICVRQFMDTINFAFAYDGSIM